MGSPKHGRRFEHQNASLVAPFDKLCFALCFHHGKSRGATPPLQNIDKDQNT